VETDLSLTKKFCVFGAVEHAVSVGVLQSFSSHELQRPESSRIRIGNRGPSPTAGVDHSNFHYFRQIQFGLKLMW